MNPHPTPNPLFEVVKEARGWLTEQVQARLEKKIREPSTTTVKLYQREVVRMVATGDPWKAASDTTKKATFFLRRAALLHRCRANIEAALKAQDQLQRGNGLADSGKRADWEKQVHAIKNALNLAKNAPDEPPKHIAARRETKRVDLFKLPGDWRETIISRLPKYEQAATISALCGCRPAELVSGVEVFVQAGMLVVRIQGAKVSEKSGQEWREMHWNLPSTNPLVIAAGRFALQNGGSITVKTPNARAFSGAMRSAGRRAFPDFPHEITPYSMRHQVASDLKAAELPGDQISKALGHSAADTKGSYGEWGGGYGAMAPDAVQAPRDVKAKKPTSTLAKVKGPSLAP